ncbi:hypothetical protein VTI74DRAFT_5166 [Chaetomium olivicolor]
MTPLALAVLHGNLPIAQHLHASGYSLTPAANNGESLLALAALAQSPSLVRWLCSLPNHQLLLNARDPAGNTALHYAVVRENPAVTTALLRAGCDTNIQCLPPREPDAHGTTAAPLLGYGTPLFCCLDTATTNPSQPLPARLAAVRLLLKHKARTDVPEEANGLLPLHAAVLSGLVPAVKVLLDEGRADVDAGSTIAQVEAMRGTTALMFAAGLTSLPMVRLLLDCGANPRAGNHLGETALHWAGVNESIGEAELREMIRLLVRGGKKQPGLDVNVRNRVGATALHGAAWKGRMVNAKVLLELGADPGFVAEDMHVDTLLGVSGTAEEFARREGHWEVAELIRDWARKRVGGWEVEKGDGQVEEDELREDDDGLDDEKGKTYETGEWLGEKQEVLGKGYVQIKEEHESEEEVFGVADAPRDRWT